MLDSDEDSAEDIELFAPTDYVCFLCGAVGAREALCWPISRARSGGATMQPLTLKTSTATQQTGRNDTR